MKLRIALAAFLLLSIGYVSSLQITSAFAATPNGGGPITSPLTYFAIWGKITYRYNGSIYNAKNVLVTAVNARTSQHVAVMTDKTGHYSLTVEPGKYIITPSDNSGTSFTPYTHVISVTTHDIPNVNFYGLLHHSPIDPQ